MSEKNCDWIILLPMSLALLVSISINVAFCFRRQMKKSQRDGNTKSYRRQSSHSSTENGQCRFRDEVQEVQENPIYGNIYKESAEPQEMMTMHHRREGNKPSESHMNYASLDLKVNKRGKHKSRVQPELSADPRPDLQARLSQPPRADLWPPEAGEHRSASGGGGSLVASQGSIYLNSQQIAMESEERGRGEAGCSDPDWPTQNGGWDPLGEAGGEEGSGEDGWMDSQC